LGSLAVGAKAIPRADPNAVWRRNIAMTKDLRIHEHPAIRKQFVATYFMLGGALVKAYSRPVILAKISERPIKRYAGVCTAT